MKRTPAPLALALVAAAVAASAQDFAGLGGLEDQLSGIRAATQAQKAIPQEPTPHAMGGGKEGAFRADALEPDAVPQVGPYQVRGIDVSHFQGAIDWGKVSASGVSFAYIKATEGGDYVDDQFAANWSGAQSAGVTRGAYHFYNFCKTGSEQADRFIATVPADAGALPATIDLEESADCATMPGKAAFRKDLADFVAKVQAAYGRLPVLYVNYSIYNLYFKGENDSYKIWIADTGDASPAMPGGAPWTVWQYGWHGAVAGVSGEVDLDVFNGTPEMLASLADGDSGVLVASLTQR
ncbi:MAG TPA: GH25 family lysozyme [Elusimicrobiota bacterium]|nr:GH25 family lysozyme [Elusimicrobiota bacterium]